MEIECGMRAPVNSIIAANLKQIDDFLLSRNIYHPLLAIFLVTKEIQKKCANLIAVMSISESEMIEAPEGEVEKDNVEQ